MYGSDRCRKIFSRIRINLKSLIYIFLGGGLGSVLRFLISAYTQKFWKLGQFPAGTFVVNILGCILIGIFSAQIIKTDSPMKFLLVTGFCGGFTTFSTLSLENYTLWQSGNYGILILYSFLSIFIGISAIFLGFWIGEN